MRSLLYVAVVGLLCSVLSFNLAPLYLSKQLISIPNACQGTTAKFQCRVASNIQPTMCYSSGRGSNNLLSFPEPVVSIKDEKDNDDGITINSQHNGLQTASRRTNLFSKRFSNVIRNTPKKGKVVKASKKWTDSEVATLREQVTKQLQPAADVNVTTNKIDWISIGKVLGRSPRQCLTKWRNMLYESKGPFTAEEDALILQRVEEWGNKTSGMWTGLSKELHRTPEALRSHWLVLRMNTVKSIHWTEEMNAALGNAYHSEKPRKKSDTSPLPLPLLWDRVSARLAALGWVVSGVQCQSQYFDYVKYGMKDAVWTPQLVELLKEMRGQGKRWCEISTKLNIIPKQLQTKWYNEHNKTLKKGPFTLEEDALIRQRVTEWKIKHDDKKTMGLWSALEKEMCRPVTNLRARWVRTLSLQTDTVKFE